MLDTSRIKAITLDLDDTLWPIQPVIERAEQALQDWLALHAPMTAALYSSHEAIDSIRRYVAESRPELRHNLSAVRRESIRLALYRAGENPLLANAAFEVFFSARQQVTLYDDALVALAFLSARFPLVALSNGNADIGRIGLGAYFCAAVHASEFGSKKPDPQIFLAAVGAASCQPGQVLHIGDDTVQDILGAQNAGLQAVWLNRAGRDWEHPQAAPPQVQGLEQLCDLLAVASVT
ncbi:MAG: HAD family hydrolase [Burkholderiaceae bacterium]